MAKERDLVRVCKGSRGRVGGVDLLEEELGLQEQNSLEHQAIHGGRFQSVLAFLEPNRLQELDAGDYWRS